MLGGEGAGVKVLKFLACIAAINARIVPSWAENNVKDANFFCSVAGV